MGTLALWICLSMQDPPFRVDGPPFLVLGDRVELEAKNVPEGAVVVWRLADGPPAAIDPRPALSPASRSVRGAGGLTVLSVGASEAEFRFAVTAERKGVRVASVEFRLRAGPLLALKVWCRADENEAGGTRRQEEIADGCRRRALEGPSTGTSGRWAWRSGSTPRRRCAARTGGSTAKGACPRS